MLRIAIAGRKGGVGKTTIAVGLASVFHSRGLRTVVVDLDPQSNAAFALGVDPAAPGTAALLQDGVAPQTVAEGLDVFPGGPGLTETPVQRAHPEDLADVLSQAPVDVIICDCPPGIEQLERLGVTAADICLIIADAHPFAALGAQRVLGDLQELRSRGRRGPDQWALVLSRIDGRRAADRRMTDVADETWPDVPTFKVHQDARLAAATSDQTLISQAASGSRGLADIEAIADWLTATNTNG